MKYRFKVWLETEGQQIFGDGLYHLLSKIQEYGSIRRAAEEMQMSYRHAWGIIKKAEERLGLGLLLKKTGGEAGGGARLTTDAERLMVKYRQFRDESEKAIKEIFSKYFEP